MFRLLRAQARRDRLQLLIWILGTALFAVGSGSAVAREFGGERSREELLRLVSLNPALLAIRGVPDGASTGAVIFFELFTYLALLAALMSTFLVVRHSRGDEEQGRTELVRSTPIGRASTLLATLLLGALANLALALAIGLGLAATGLPIDGAMLAGVATGACGLAFCGVAALAAQVATTGRAANTLGGVTVGAAWVIRALGDAFGTASPDGLRVTSAWPSWLSPIGWGQQTHAFGSDARWWPLLLDVGLFAAAAGVALAVVARRDLGAGLIGDRPGRATGSLHSSIALAWRLQRGGVIGWTAGAAVLGLFAGGLAQPAIDALRSNPSVADVVDRLVAGRTNDLLDTFLAAIMTFLGVLAAGAAMQAVLRARTEESDGRTELLLSGRGGPGNSLRDGLIVALGSLVAVAVAGGVFAAVALAAAGHPERFAGSVASAFVQLPAAAVFAAFAGLVFAVLPRAAVPVGWTVLVLGFVLGQFGALFALPQAIRDLSPFSHTPVVPGPDIDWAPVIVMAIIALAIAGIATALSHRRDLVT